MRDFVILSAERPQWGTRQNAWRDSELGETIRDLGFSQRSVLGYWEGIAEASRQVELRAAEPIADQVDTLLDLARDFEQDAILHVSGHLARIIARDGSVILTGQWARVADVSRHQGYTQIGEAYYAII